MSSTTITNPPQNLNHHPAFNHLLPRTAYSIPIVRTYKEYKFVFDKSVKKIMAAKSTKTRIIGVDYHDKCISPTHSSLEHHGFLNNSVPFHQPATGGIHFITVNRLSKWVVAICFGGLALFRHDDLALWAATGAVSNFILCITLKRILKQERPSTQSSSGHGMPSSHAQSIFFTLVFVILSVFEWMGSNGVTSVLGVLIVALGSYFSWLWVLLGYHTTNQVVVGTIVGSSFSVMWFEAWEAIVQEAYSSNLLVQYLVFVGAVCYCLGFISFFLWSTNAIFHEGGVDDSVKSLSSSPLVDWGLFEVSLSLSGASSSLGVSGVVTKKKGITKGKRK
ncbi:lipid phosphate phosphatase epsilon 1, chloroplastic-like [Rutidosis leptorrhynchoides]|uniref:lipid phosphate phosphatase epsilon 1, chloroplastic-like n=1 Tax=Rutidosis leptorrhynchoides TaxID=125765 RepID=UPI003A9A092C